MILKITETFNKFLSQILYIISIKLISNIWSINYLLIWGFARNIFSSRIFDSFLSLWYELTVVLQYNNLICRILHSPTKTPDHLIIWVMWIQNDFTVHVHDKTCKIWYFLKLTRHISLLFIRGTHDLELFHGVIW